MAWEVVCIRFHPSPSAPHGGPPRVDGRLMLVPLIDWPLCELLLFRVQADKLSVVTLNIFHKELEQHPSVS